MYKLHCFAQSGNSYKVALMLTLLKQPWQPVPVDFMNGATRDAVWRAHTNVMGEAPVLEDGEKRMTQSGVILIHLARKHGQFDGRNEDERDEILRWVLFDNHKFTSYFATYRFLRAFGPSMPDPAVLAFLRGRVDAAYAIVDKHLSAHDFMVGERPTIADLSLCGYVFYPKEESGLDVAKQYPAIEAWKNRLRALTGWVDPYALMPGERIAPKWVASS